MGELGFIGKYGKGGVTVQIGIDVISFFEENLNFLYAPALDITGYGENEMKARQSFELAIQEFLRYTLNKGTFHSELLRLGWEVKGKKKNKKYEAPYLDQLFQKRDYLSEIVRDKEFSRFKKEVAMPVPA